MNNIKNLINLKLIFKKLKTKFLLKENFLNYLNVLSKFSKTLKKMAEKGFFIQNAAKMTIKDIFPPKIRQQISSILILYINV